MTDLGNLDCRHCFNSTVVVVDNERAQTIAMQHCFGEVRLAFALDIVFPDSKIFCNEE